MFHENDFFIDEGENPNLPTSFRDITEYIRSNSRWTCVFFAELPPDCFSFSDGETVSSETVLNWYKKYRNGCDGFQVVYTGREYGKNTGFISLMYFGIKCRGRIGKVTFAGKP